MRHIVEYHPEYADVVELITKKFDVDNYLDSFNKIEERIATCRRLRELLFLGGFVLGQMVTYVREILKSLPGTKIANPDFNIYLDALPVHRTLGLEWNGEGDHFFFTLVIPTAMTKSPVRRIRVRRPDGISGGSPNYRQGIVARCVACRS